MSTTTTDTAPTKSALAASRLAALPESEQIEILGTTLVDVLRATVLLTGSVAGLFNLGSESSDDEYEAALEQLHQDFVLTVLTSRVVRAEWDEALGIESSSVEDTPDA